MDDSAETWTVVIDADTGPLQQQLGNAARYGRQFSSALLSAFDGLVVKGRSFGDVLGSLALSLSRMALQVAFKPLEQGFSQLFSGLLGAAPGGALAFAKGGVLSGGMPVPFAAGGVITSPVGFPLADGRTGLMGERGPEAIMPLARGRDGRLGVVAGGGASSSIVVNVSTPDVESFRRSEAQIAAMLARATALGQRNL